MDDKETHIEELILRCAGNDGRAQKELYGRYAKAMYNVCRRMLGNEEDARDALQEVFCKCFQKIYSFKGDSAFGAWLKRIAVNHCINCLQRDKSKYWTELKEMPVEDEGVYVYDDAWETNTDIRRIVDALDKISEGCKTVFNLYMFEGYDHQEIAEILSVSESASKAQLSKAKQKIRDLLESKNMKKAS